MRSNIHHVHVEQERIPFNEGYKRKSDPITQDKLDAVIAKVAAVV